MRQKIERWIEKRIFNLVLIFLVIAGWVIFFASVAIGKTTTEAFMKGDKIIVCEYPLEYPKPAESLGIPDEVAMEVVSQGKSQKFKTELSRKVNFFAFPIVLEIEEVAKIASYDLTQGWLVEDLEDPKILQQKLWNITVSVAIVFFGVLALVRLNEHYRFSPVNISDLALVMLLVVLVMFGVVMTCILFVNTRAEPQVLGYPLLFIIMVSIAILYGFVLSLRRKRKNKKPNTLSSV